MTISILLQAMTHELEQVRACIAAQLTSGLPQVNKLLAELPAYQGKMLRPMLTLMAGQWAGRLTDKHYRLSAAIEMIHLATLLHDDVLDEADRRRGKPSVNVMHGNEASILLGDLLLSRAFNLVVSIGSQELLDYVSRTTHDICEGELLQVLQRGRYDLTEETYYQIITGKTASLMQCCCVLGAKLGGADEAQQQAISDYGRQVGIAFQIMDDVRDLDNGDDAASKTLGTDMVKEKMTLPLIHYFSNVDQADRDQACFWLQEGSPAYRRQLTKRLNNVGSVEYARHQARNVVERAQQAIIAYANGQDLCRLAESIL